MLNNDDKRKISRYQYAEEKLGTAIYILATGQGKVRARLLDAFMEFHPLNAEDFPPELLNDWIWIKEQLTRFGPIITQEGKVEVGSVAHTLSRIQNRTGQRIAQRIFDLHANLQYCLADPA